MDTCIIYSLFVLGTTAVICYIGRNWPFETLGGMLMFLPALFSPWFAHSSFISQLIGYEKGTLAFQYSVSGGMLVIIILIGVAGLDSVTGWGEIDTTPRSTPPEASKDLLPGFLRAAGEEIGWRCFLLPCLLQQYSNFWAIAITGMVWGLYHVPVMVIVTQRLKPRNSLMTVIVQSLSVFISAYIHAWVAIKSDFSFWAPTIMHFTWNRLNPVVFGSIYTQEGGRVKGEQWLINGEGLAGCIVMAPVAAALLYNIGF